MSEHCVKSIKMDTKVATAIAESIDRNIQKSLEKAREVGDVEEEYEPFNVFRRIKWIRENYPDF